MYIRYHLSFNANDNDLQLHCTSEIDQQKVGGHMQQNQTNMKDNQSRNSERFCSRQITNIASKFCSPDKSLPCEKNDILDSDFGVSRFTSGVMLQVFDGAEAIDTCAYVEFSPGLVLSVVLEGNITLVLDGDEREIETTDSQAAAFAVNIGRTDQHERTLARVNKARKINITLPLNWIKSQLKNCGLMESSTLGFVGQHLNFKQWDIQQSDLSIAEQIINTKSSTSWSNKLQLEALTLQLASKFIEKIQANNQQKLDQQMLPTRRSMQKAVIIKSKIDERIQKLNSPEERLTLEDIASSLGMSSSNLQRLFKSTYKQTIVEYVRTTQLEKAKDALIHQGITIGEAAYIAGYKYTPNFAIAFKRMFGIAPGSL